MKNNTEYTDNIKCSGFNDSKLYKNDDNMMRHDYREGDANTNPCINGYYFVPSPDTTTADTTTADTCQACGDATHQADDIRNEEKFCMNNTATYVSRCDTGYEVQDPTGVVPDNLPSNFGECVSVPCSEPPEKNYIISLLIFQRLE